MFSKSSNSGTTAPLLLGRVAGHRGASGEITVRVALGEASVWTWVRQVRIELAGGAPRAPFEVEGARAYRDRLVLKLRGVVDAAQAERLRGCDVLVDAEQAPPLPVGRYFVSRLLGMEVRDETRGRLGRVRGVRATKGADLLVVERGTSGERGPSGAQEDELWIPFVEPLVREVDERAGEIRVRLPEGLVELNLERRGAEE